MIRRLTVLGCFVLVSMLMSGCGSLSVKVDVLEPGVVEAELDRMLLRDSLPKVLAQSDENLKQNFTALQGTHYQLYNELAAEYRADAAKLESAARQQLEGLADALIEDFPKAISPRYAAEQTEVLGLNQQIKSIYFKIKDPATPGKKIVELRSDLVLALRERQFRLANFDKIVRDDVAGLLKKSQRDLPRLADTQLDSEKLKRAKAKVAEVRKSMIGGQGLVESPYTYAVAAAPESKWSERYNRTLGDAYFGNLDIAIKMESLGEFTIKGITFDPSDVARAVSKVTVQALVLSAQMSGVPIKTPSQPTTQQALDGGALAASSSRLGDIEETSARVEAKMQDYRSALVTIGQSILREQPKIGGTPAQRSAAVSAIKSTFDAHKTRLSLDELQGGR